NGIDEDCGGSDLICSADTCSNGIQDGDETGIDCGGSCPNPCSTNECSDGIDNDNDGLIDWQYDLGCYGQTDNTEGGKNAEIENGWTVYERSFDNIVVYVSSSSGNNGWDGLAPEWNGSSGPVKTIERGYQIINGPNDVIEQIRLGISDWLLLKRGDEWKNESLGGKVWNGEWYRWRKKGRSEDYPVVIGSYGNSIKRPVVKDIRIEVSNISLIGIEFDGVGGAIHSGVTLLSTHQNILFEDSWIKGYVDGFNIQGPKNFIVRRSIITDAAYGRAQGIYAYNIVNLTIEENVIDHNGWLEDGINNATVLNHNLYLNEGSVNVIVRGNIISRASSHGVQLRPGGLIENNLFIENPLAGFVAGDPPNNPNSSIINNVVLGGNRTVGIVSRGEGFSVIRDDSIIENNIIAHKTCVPGRMNAIALNVDGNTNKKVIVRNNTIYHWCGDDIGISNASGNSITIQDNIIQNNVDADDGVIGTEDLLTPILYSGNTYHTLNAMDAASVWGYWFRQDAGIPRFIIPTDWSSISDEIDAKFGLVNFKDPNRDLTSYLQTLGTSGNADKFISEARNQSKYNYRVEYTAYAVNNYIREGFEIEQCNTGQTRLCSLQQGVCSGSIEVCTNNIWPGCSSINYGINYEIIESSCSNSLDNDCDGLVDLSDSDCIITTTTSTSSSTSSTTFNIAETSTTSSSTTTSTTTTTQQPSGTGSSSGGGRKIEIKPCTEDWTCFNWMNCEEFKAEDDKNQRGFYQQRECVDRNNCGTKLLKPVTERICEPVTEKKKVIEKEKAVQPTEEKLEEETKENIIERIRNMVNSFIDWINPEKGITKDIIRPKPKTFMDKVLDSKGFLILSLITTIIICFAVYYYVVRKRK
ncbi:MAG: hypothetical protein AABX29_08595, partial [Nanoarchaeota archaeon]